MCMKKDLLVLNDKFLCLDVCAFRNSCKLYSSFLISFMEFMKQAVCDKDSTHKYICLCSIESMKLGERMISSDWFQKARLEITL